jgi:8-oxo-dGTP diphosphatase
VAEERTINKIGLAIISGHKILLARYKNAKIFYFIGGQVRDGETDEDCLQRKVPDEIGVTLQNDDFEYLGEFHDTADGRKDTMLLMKLYKGEVIGEPKPTHDVEELRYFDTSDDQSSLSAIAVNKVFPWLKVHGYIN